MLRKPTVRRVLLPLALLISAFSVTATAHAWTLHEVNYGPVGLQPSGQRGDFYQTSPWRGDITGNIAIYEGSGTVGVCQKTYDLTSGVYREGCGNNAVGNALNLTPYYGHYLFPGVKNNSAWYHTFRGVYYYGTP